MTDENTKKPEENETEFLSPDQPAILPKATVAGRPFADAELEAPPDHDVQN